MVYKYCSSDEVISQILRRTRLTDATYADDILEWLRDGLNLMRVRNMLVPSYKVLEVSQNITALPCGLITIDGIFYNNHRLRHGTGVIDTRIAPASKLEQTFDSYFTTDTTTDGWTKNEQSYLLARGDDIRPNAPVSQGDYYIPYPNHIQTSFSEGCVTIFYRKMPTDKKGFPLVPDEENTKFALFWWIMANLSLSGYKHNDPRMDFEYCESKYKRYAHKGKGIIKYWSVDKREAIMNLTVNLIPPQGYYDLFFVGGEQPKTVGFV